MSNDIAPKDDFITQMQLAFQEHIVPPPPSKDRFCEWYRGEVHKLDALEAQFEKMYEIRLQEIHSAKASLQYFHGQEFRQRSKAMIEADGNKKKSVNLLTGTVGFRTIKAKLLVTNKQLVMEWAETHCPQAIKMIKDLLLTPLMDYLKDTGDVPPGTELIGEHQKFYPWIDSTPKLSKGIEHSESIRPETE